MGGININILILYSTTGLHELPNSLHRPFWGVVSFHCPLPPSSGNMPEVQQMRAEEGVETGKKKNRRKGNSNALPGNSRQPATTSPHDISERKMRQSLLQHRRVAFHLNAALPPIPPNWLNNNPIRASHIPPTDTIHRVFFPVRLRNASEVNARRLRHHQLRTLRFP